MNMPEEDNLRQIIPIYAQQLINTYLFMMSQDKTYMLQQLQTADCKLFENQHDFRLEDSHKFKKISVTDIVTASIHCLQNEIDDNLVLSSFIVKATSEIAGREQPLTIKVGIRGTKFQQFYNLKISSLWYLHEEAAESE